MITKPPFKKTIIPTHHDSFADNEIAIHGLKPRSATMTVSQAGIFFLKTETKPKENHPNHHPPPPPNMFLDINVQKITIYSTTK